MMNSFISTDQELRQGDTLFSENKNFKAVFQTDSNFVVYKWTPIWASQTMDMDGFRIILQQDNNLVMYDKNNMPLWATNTSTNSKSDKLRLTMNNDGNMVLDKDGDLIWTSNNNTGKKLQ